MGPGHGYQSFGGGFAPPSDVAQIANRSYTGKNLYEFDPTRGTYVWHCHVIDHEDNEMMRPYRVTW
jgi:spore coat protein A, manganese oxidase